MKFVVCVSREGFGEFLYPESLLRLLKYNKNGKPAAYRVGGLTPNICGLSQLLLFPKWQVSQGLAALGIRGYRQVLFKPYRVIYRVVGQRIYIYLIVDGRRDMQSLLARRLLGA